MKNIKYKWMQMSKQQKVLYLTEPEEYIENYDLIGIRKKILLLKNYYSLFTRKRFA